MKSEQSHLLLVLGRGRGWAAPLRHSDACLPTGRRDYGGAAVRVAGQRVNCNVTREAGGGREPFSLLRVWG